MNKPKLEIVEVPDENGGGLGINVNGRQREWIRPEYLAALRKHLNEGMVERFVVRDERDRFRLIGVQTKEAASGMGAFRILVPEQGE